MRPTSTNRRPTWLKVKAPPPGLFRATGALLDELRVNTVCREARCPNKGECYSAGAAAFLILGNVCTRGCRFCAIGQQDAGTDDVPRTDSADHPALGALNEDEPRRIAEAVARLELRHVVITSVTRDDLPDGGAGQFAAAINAVRRSTPGTTVEVLIPDFGGDREALGVVFAARPDVLAHNLETVPRLYSQVRPQASYGRSLELLTTAACWARHSCSPANGPAAAPRRPMVKTGLMVGLGERDVEMHQTLADCAAAGADIVTAGQYLQPRRECLPVTRYLTPEEFRALERRGKALRITVRAAPFVRSSYHAGEFLPGSDESLVADHPATAITAAAARSDAMQAQIGRWTTEHLR